MAEGAGEGGSWGRVRRELALRATDDKGPGEGTACGRLGGAAQEAGKAGCSSGVRGPCTQHRRASSNELWVFPLQVRPAWRGRGHRPPQAAARHGHHGQEREQRGETGRILGVSQVTAEADRDAPRGWDRLAACARMPLSG